MKLAVVDPTQGFEGDGGNLNELGGLHQRAYIEVSHDMICTLRSSLGLPCREGVVEGKKRATEPVISEDSK